MTLGSPLRPRKGLVGHGLDEAGASVKDCRVRLPCFCPGGRVFRERIVTASGARWALCGGGGMIGAVRFVWRYAQCYGERWLWLPDARRDWADAKAEGECVAHEAGYRG